MEPEATVAPEATAVTTTPVEAKGERVTPEQIKSYAKGKCKLCLGSGTLVRYASPLPSGVVTKMTRIRVEDVCGCAGKRFIEKNRDKLTHDQEGIYWKPGTSWTEGA